MSRSEGGVSSLGRQMVTGAGWMVMLRVLDRGIGLISFTILARLLVPEDFGLIALASSFIGLLQIAGELSVELALIRDQKAQRHHYDTAWTLKIIKGFILLILIGLLAQFVAAFFHDPRLTIIIYCLAIGTCIESFENIGVVNFRKYFEFHREFFYLFLSRLLAAVLTLSLAFTWPEYWVLVVGMIGYRMIRVGLSYAVSDYRPKFSLEAIHEIFGFSKWMMLQNLIYGIHTRFPSFVIGRLSSLDSLAFYEIAFQTSNIATTELRAPIRRALFPGFAKMATESGRLQQGFLKTFGILVLLGLPIPLGLAVLAPYFVHLFLGSQWIAAVPFIEVLALNGVIQTFSTNSHLIYLALNKPRITTYLSLFHFLLLVPVLLWAVGEMGALGAAWALLVTSTVLLIVDFSILLPLLSLSVREILKVSSRLACAGFLMYLSLALYRWYFPISEHSVTIAFQLLTGVFLGALLYGALVFGLWYGLGRPRGPEQHIYLTLQSEIQRLSTSTNWQWENWWSSSNDPEFHLSKTRSHKESVSRPAIILFGKNEWNHIWHTRQHIGSRFGAKGYHVVYSNGPAFIWERGTSKWKRSPWFSSQKMMDGVQVYRTGRWMMRWPRIHLWDRWLKYYYVWKLMRLANWSRATSRIVYVFHPSFTPYLPHLGDCHIVYHCDDAFSLMPGWDPQLSRLEAELVGKADLVLASSPAMAKTLPTGGKAPIRQLANAADVELYGAGPQSSCPRELHAIPHPRIGYTGSINLKVDVSLVASLATRKPEWHWVFIGPVDRVNYGEFHGYASYSDGLERCRKLPNVHFLGPKPYQELPAYVAHMDVNTMCYRCTPEGWWSALYPLKLHEYLAAGKPIVASNLEVLQEFSHVVAIANEMEEWEKALDSAIRFGGIGDAPTRYSIAQENTWDIRVDQLIQWFQELDHPRNRHNVNDQ